MRYAPLAIAFVAIAAACLAMQETQSPEFQNLRVLPHDISHDDLYLDMRAWSQSLGVKCVHCHPRVGEDLDFVTDDQPEKDIARDMVRMTERMNADYAKILKAHGGSVTCYTCHHGKTTPDWKLPPRPAA